MRALIQRVSRAEVRVQGEIVGSIGPGLSAFVGVTHSDTAEHARKLAPKLWHLRVFADDGGVMNRSLAETSRQIVVVSQFTLYGDTNSGRRPSWSAAAKPGHAEPLIEALVLELRSLGATVATGRFRAEMQVELVNDGPCTVMVEV